MAADEPFGSEQEMIEKASTVWWDLRTDDWLDAFKAHPKIGDRETVSEWSRQEQSAAAASDQSQTSHLKRLNREYEQRFGYIFIICATGKSAGQILESLRQRIHHSPDAEIRIAAGEQLAITHLRLKKWMQESQ